MAIPAPGHFIGLDSEGDFIGRGFMEFKHKLSDSTSLYDTLLIEGGKDNTFAQNDFGVQVTMTDKFAIKAGLQVRHNTDVIAPITKGIDTTTSNPANSQRCRVPSWPHRRPAAVTTPVHGRAGSGNLALARAKD